MSSVVARLPAALRDDLKAPLGPVYTDAEELLAEVDGPLIAVGDVVTAHLVRADRPPDLAVVDERTERTPVDETLLAVLPDPDATVENPAATITGELVTTLREALAAGRPTTVLVDGEEDLATLPLVLLAPNGASVVYGQPGEGMVHVVIDDAIRQRTRRLLERFEGEVDALLALVEGRG